LLALFSELELVPLPEGRHLFDYGDAIEYTYFPTNAIVSLQYVMEDGATTEIAVVGREGVAGVALRCRARQFCGGGAGRRLWLSLKSSMLREVFYTGGPLAQLLMRYTSEMFARLAKQAWPTAATPASSRSCAAGCYC
jgi:hypothetical protein